MNKTVIRLLSESGAPEAPIKQDDVTGRPRRDVSWLVGSWSAQQADEFDVYLAEMRRIDPEQWK